MWYYIITRCRSKFRLFVETRFEYIFCVEGVSIKLLLLLFRLLTFSPIKKNNKSEKIVNHVISS